MTPIITDVLNTGDLAFIIAPPKSRASFLALQIALTIAGGEDTLGFKVPNPTDVHWFNYECNPAHFRQRLSDMDNVLGHESDFWTSEPTNLIRCGYELLTDRITSVSVAVVDPLFKATSFVNFLSSYGFTTLSIHYDEELALRQGDAVFHLEPRNKDTDEFTLSFSFRNQPPRDPWELRWLDGRFIRAEDAH